MFDEMTLDDVRDLAQSNEGSLRFSARCYLTRLGISW